MPLVRLALDSKPQRASARQAYERAEVETRGQSFERAGHGGRLPKAYKQAE